MRYIILGVIFHLKKLGVRLLIWRKIIENNLNNKISSNTYFSEELSQFCTKCLSFFRMLGITFLGRCGRSKLHTLSISNLVVNSRIHAKFLEGTESFSQFARKQSKQCWIALLTMKKSGIQGWRRQCPLRTWRRKEKDAWFYDLILA